MLKLLQQIIDDTNEHYFSHVSLPNTAFSAQRINANLRRLGNQMREMHCINPPDLLASASLIPELRNLITGTNDFQDLSRAIRPITDPLNGLIGECEIRLRNNIAAPRKLRAKVGH